jgi:serine phosphatase RsbU (regulator of sigma subunit)
MGLAELSQFTETNVELHPGDFFLLYTDGLFGAAEKQRQRLRPEQLAESINSSVHNAENILKAILLKSAPADPNDRQTDDVAAVIVLRSE